MCTVRRRVEAGNPSAKNWSQRGGLPPWLFIFLHPVLPPLRPWAKPCTERFGSRPTVNQKGGVKCTVYPGYGCSHNPQLRAENKVFSPSLTCAGICVITQNLHVHVNRSSFVYQTSFDRRTAVYLGRGWIPADSNHFNPKTILLRVLSFLCN